MEIKNNVKLNTGDIITMKKSHACGGTTWLITRLGVDIGLKCTTCNHIILMDRLELYKKMKKKESITDEK